MLKASLRSVLSHKLRLTLSAVAVVLGVAFVAGTLVFTDTINKTFQNLFDQVSSDVTVTKKAAFDATFEGGQQFPSTVPAALVDQISGIPGVEAVVGAITVEGVRVIGPDGKLLGSTVAPGIGVDWTESGVPSPVRLVEGNPPSEPGEVAIDTVTAKQGSLKVGDRVTVITPGPRLQAVVTGVMKFGNSGNLAGATLTAFDPGTAHQLLGSPDFTEILVKTAGGATHQEVRDRIAASLPSGYEVLTKQQQADKNSSDIEQGLQFITIFLLVFAGVAVFVGIFLILNTFSMLVAQRTRELALFRAIGASRRQVTMSVLAEALVTGIVGSTLGVGLGIGLAVGLQALFATFGFDITVDSLQIAPRTIVVAYLVGIPVTVLGALFPARRAAKVPPVAAMRDDIAMPARSLHLRAIVGAVITVVGAAVFAVSPIADGGLSAALLGAGVLGVFVGIAVLSPVLSRPVVRALGAAYPRLFGAVGRLSRENALRNPRRTAATASALMIGLALVGAISVLSASANSSLGRLVDRSVGSDFILSDAFGTPFSPQVADSLEGVDGVASVTRQRYAPVQLDGDTAFMSAMSADSLDEALALDFASGSTAGLAGRGLLVDKSTAAEKGWQVGATVPARFQNGTKLDLKVGGIYDTSPILGPYAVSLETLAAGGVKPLDSYVLINVADGADPASVKRALDAKLASHPEVALKDQTEFKAEQRGSLNQLLYLIYALLGLAIVIAVMGIVNTLALSVTERTREIGLLRAVGMSRRQLRRMVRLESVVISVFGAVLGLTIGVAFGVALQRVLADEGIDVLSVPAGQLVGFLVIAAVVGVLAAVWPARRAARLDVLRAITTE
jgi:putative ABC transport system permease protein